VSGDALLGPDMPGTLIHHCSTTRGVKSFAAQTHGTVIRECTITSADKYSGIDTDFDGSSFGQGWLIEHNTITVTNTTTNSYGIDLNTSSRATIIGNDITYANRSGGGVVSPIYGLNGTGVNIHGNRIRCTMNMTNTAAIYCDGGQYWTIADNYIVRLGGTGDDVHGVFLKDTSADPNNITVAGNAIIGFSSGSASAGIKSTVSTTGTIAWTFLNNRIHAALRGIDLRTTVSSGTLTYTIAYNKLTGITGAQSIYCQMGTPSGCQFNIYDGAAPAGTYSGTDDVAGTFANSSPWRWMAEALYQGSLEPWKLGSGGGIVPIEI
jgi:hypothetical protein